MATAPLFGLTRRHAAVALLGQARRAMTALEFATVIIVHKHPLPVVEAQIHADVDAAMIMIVVMAIAAIIPIMTPVVVFLLMGGFVVVSPAGLVRLLGQGRRAQQNACQQQDCMTQP
jgi:hypothetical protein